MRTGIATRATSKSLSNSPNSTYVDRERALTEGNPVPNSSRSSNLPFAGSESNNFKTELPTSTNSVVEEEKKTDDMFLHSAGICKPTLEYARGTFLLIQRSILEDSKNKIQNEINEANLSLDVFKYVWFSIGSSLDYYTKIHEYEPPISICDFINALNKSEEIVTFDTIIAITKFYFDKKPSAKIAMPDNLYDLDVTKRLELLFINVVPNLSRSAQKALVNCQETTGKIKGELIKLYEEESTIVSWDKIKTKIQDELNKVIPELEIASNRQAEEYSKFCVFEHVKFSQLKSVQQQIQENNENICVYFSKTSEKKWLENYFKYHQSIDTDNLDKVLEIILKNLPQLSYRHPKTGDSLLDILISQHQADKIYKEDLVNIHQMAKYLVNLGHADVQLTSIQWQVINSEPEGNQTQGMLSILLHQEESSTIQPKHEALLAQLIVLKHIRSLNDEQKTNAEQNRNSLMVIKNKEMAIRAAKEGHPILLSLLLGDFVAHEVKISIKEAEGKYYEAYYEQAFLRVAFRYWQMVITVCNLARHTQSKWALTLTDGLVASTNILEDDLPWLELPNRIHNDRERLLEEHKLAFEEWARISISNEDEREKLVRKFNQEIRNIGAKVENDQKDYQGEFIIELKNKISIKEVDILRNHALDMENLEYKKLEIAASKSHSLMLQLSLCYNLYWKSKLESHYYTLIAYDSSLPFSDEERKENNATVKWYNPLSTIGVSKEVHIQAAWLRDLRLPVDVTDANGKKLFQHAISTALYEPKGGGFASVVVLLQHGYNWEQIITEQQLVNFDKLRLAADKAVRFGLSEIEIEVIAFLKDQGGRSHANTFNFLFLSDENNKDRVEHLENLAQALKKSHDNMSDVKIHDWAKKIILEKNNLKISHNSKKILLIIANKIMQAFKEDKIYSCYGDYEKVASKLGYEVQVLQNKKIIEGFKDQLVQLNAENLELKLKLSNPKLLAQASTSKQQDTGEQSEYDFTVPEQGGSCYEQAKGIDTIRGKQSLPPPPGDPKLTTATTGFSCTTIPK